MLAGSHVALGAAAWIAAAPHLGRPPLDPEALALAVFGGLLPDIDHPKSWVGRRLRPVSDLVAGLFGHRGVTHSLLAVLGCGWLLRQGVVPAALGGAAGRRLSQPPGRRPADPGRAAPALADPRHLGAALLPRRIAVRAAGRRRHPGRRLVHAGGAARPAGGAATVRPLSRLRARSRPCRCRRACHHHRSAGSPNPTAPRHHGRSLAADADRLSPVGLQLSSTLWINFLLRRVAVPHRRLRLHDRNFRR